MDALIIFWTAILVVGLLGAALRDVLGDDPGQGPDHLPPASHEPDPFSRTGSSFH